MHPGVLAVSMRKYAYAVLLLAHTVPFPPTSNVEHELKHCDPKIPLVGSGGGGSPSMSPNRPSQASQISLCSPYPSSISPLS